MLQTDRKGIEWKIRHNSKQIVYIVLYYSERKTPWSGGTISAGTPRSHKLKVIKCVWNNEKVFRWHKESRTKTAWPYERQDYRARPNSTHSQQVIPRKKRKTGQHKWTTSLWRPGTASRISSPVCVSLRQDTQIVTLVTRTKKKNNMFDGRDVATGRDRKWLVWEEQAHVQMNELGRGIPTIERLVGKCLIWLE